MTVAMDRLSDIDAANVARCARVLLRRPLLRAGGPDGELLPLIYRHRATLADVFAELLGYRLVVERRFARLYKSGPGDDATRGEAAMSPRGYAYLALTIACLTGVGTQVLLSRLVGDVRAAAIEAGLDVADTLSDRRALAAALRHLISLGVITETEGTVGSLTGEALITIDTDLLGHLLAGPLAEADSPEALITLATRPGARGVEHTMRRRLVENPVVLHAELAPEESTWLKSRQRRESLILDRMFGLATEIRLEGVAITDPEEYLTDLPFPGSGTVARIALLALPGLLENSEPDEHGRHPVTRAVFRRVCADLVDDYPAAWSRQATENLDVLVHDVLELLRRLGLRGPDLDDHRDDGGGVGAVDSASGHEPLITINPVAHRWCPQPDAPVGPPPSPHPEPVVDDTLSLFETDLTDPTDEDPVGSPPTGEQRRGSQNGVPTPPDEDRPTAKEESR